MERASGQPSFANLGPKWFYGAHPYDRAEYLAALRRADSDPSYDLYEKFRPNMPKLEIGRYVAAQGIPVPFIRNQQEWQDAFDAGEAMIRSELMQDYSGYSGLLSSKRFYVPDYEAGYDEDKDEWPYITKVEAGHIGSRAITEAMEGVLTEGMRLGQLHPGEFMRRFEWTEDIDSLYDQSQAKDIPIEGLTWAMRSGSNASFWRYVPGKNLRVYRDPVRPDHYYMKGDTHNDAFEIAGEEIDEGKLVRPLYPQGDTDPLDYVIPTREVVDLYEKVRTLPRFDARELPVMEMQLGDDGQLHFLQYYKTGTKLQEGTPFSMLDSVGTLPLDAQVRGGTSSYGLHTRLYLDPHVYTPRMEGQGFYLGFDMLNRFNSLFLQHACRVGRVVVSEYILSFRDNHSDSMPLYKPPVAIALWSSEARELAHKLDTLRPQHNNARGRRDLSTVAYIGATIVSNGIRASIKSDWQVREESAQ